MQTLYTDHATISDKHPKRMMPPFYYIQASFVLSCYAALLRRELPLITQISAMRIAIERFLSIFLCLSKTIH